MNELTGMIIGFVLTLFVFSYILGDNPLYRLAVHMLVGVSAGYAAVVVVSDVILPIYEQIRTNPTSTESLLWLIPILLAIVLMLKRLPALSLWLGNTPIAYLVGIGASVALIGAIMGTLIPQVTAVGNTNQLTAIETILVALFTVSTLLTFQFTGRRRENGEWAMPIWLKSLTLLGRAVIMVTFGALFAGVLATSLMLLTERITQFFDLF